MRAQKVVRDLVRNFVMGPAIMVGLFVLMSVEYAARAVSMAWRYCRG